MAPMSDRRWEGAGMAAVLAVAVIALIAAVIALFDAESQYDALNERFEMATARLDAIESEQRPWVSATMAIAGDLIFDKQGGHLPVAITLTNVGRSPGFNITAMAVLVTANGSIPSDPQRELERRCDGIATIVAGAIRSPVPISWNDALFPGQRSVLAEAAAIPANPAGTGHAGPTLVISCIDYRIGRGIDHHRSGNVYYLKRAGKDDARPWTDIDLSRRETIPAAQLRLSPALAGTFAD